MSEDRPPNNEVPEPVRRIPGRRSDAPDDVAAILADHASAMLRAARRTSLCEDDAHDAVQAAAERFLRYQGTVDRQTLTGWLVTVARHEALRIRERRVRAGDGLEEDDRRLAHPGEGPADRVTREEELAVAREALTRLKPDERRALWLQAEGRSYDEIARELGWSRTKTNRALTEGRARLRRGLRGIAEGEGCAIAGPRIDRLAAGTASAEDLRLLRPHVRRCPRCRARLRRARGGRWSLLPPFLLPWLPWAARVGATGIGTAPPARTRMVEAVAERLITVVPATTGMVSEAGLAWTAGVAAVALGTGVVAGGHGHHHRPHHQAHRAPAHAARPASHATPAALTAAPGVPAATAPVAEKAADPAPPPARSDAKRRARERAGAPRAAKRRAARRRAAKAAARRAGSSSDAPSAGDGARAPAPNVGGPAASSGGAAADEFSFEGP